MKKFLLNNGSVVVLVLLCVYYSIVTIGRQHPVTPAAGEEVAQAILADTKAPSVLIVTRDTDQDREFARAVRAVIEAGGGTIVDSVHGIAIDAGRAIRTAGEAGKQVDAIATHQPSSEWGPLKTERLEESRNEFRSLRGVKLYKPVSYVWPSFLTRPNLVNVVNQNADIAIIAIGMTLVIITAGIDLSVGSLVAVAGVVTAVTIQKWAGGADAGAAGMIGCSLIGIGVCLLCGVFNGVMVTYFRVPAFVVTLGIMMVARGVALIIAVQYQSSLLGGGTKGTPEAVKVEAIAWPWLGNGSILGVPNPILLMLVLYILAHLVMTRTSFGRYVYAVGGNPEAARLSGVPVFAVLISVYALCGAMAGLAGVIDASRFEGGRPIAGDLYELKVIAAVVVGGTSLAGGEGRIFGTLIGAMIIAVIENGLNMAGVASYEQKIVFGLLILVAVLLDRLKARD
ncbi:MAG: ABC transporter permease [Planctomycetota bacterium]|nr:ABC transporter permease [Planctomycetota bacterium]